MRTRLQSLMLLLTIGVGAATGCLFPRPGLGLPFVESENPKYDVLSLYGVVTSDCVGAPPVRDMLVELITSSSRVVAADRTDALGKYALNLQTAPESDVEGLFVRVGQLEIPIATESGETPRRGSFRTRISVRCAGLFSTPTLQDPAKQSGIASDGASAKCLPQRLQTGDSGKGTDHPVRLKLTP